MDMETINNMDMKTINNYLSTVEYKLESDKFKNSSSFINFKDFLGKIPINTKYYNNSNKYNAVYAQLYKRKQGTNIEACTKKMNITLNKLSNINHDIIVKECNDLILDCSEIVPKMIESIFIKCSNQHSLCQNYIDLLIKLPQKDIKQVVQRKVDLYLKRLIDMNENNISQEESYDEFCSRLKEKSMLHGYSLFLTLLHNKEYINLDSINKIMDIIVEKIQSETIVETTQVENTEENKEKIIQALYAISMNIDNVDKLESYIPLLQEVIDNGNLSMKLEFQIQDILDRFQIN